MGGQNAFVANGTFIYPNSPFSVSRDDRYPPNSLTHIKEQQQQQSEKEKKERVVIRLVANFKSKNTEMRHPVECDKNEFHASCGPL